MLIPWPPPPGADCYTTDVIRYTGALSDRAIEKLVWHGILRTSDLTALSKSEFLALNGIGRRLFVEVDEFLRCRGLSFRTEPEKKRGRRWTSPKE